MAVGAVEGTDSAAYGRGANGWPTGFDHWQGKPESVPPMSSYDQFGSPMPDAESNGMSRAAYPPPGGYDLAGHRQPPPPPLVGGPPNWHLHRSMSTPDAGGLHPHHHHHPGAPIDMGGSSSMAEKKRNKLGYHRTSVACSKY